jgi:hypothetical protein
MERQVIFRDRQELQSADLNNAQSFARQAIDNVVRDALIAGRGFAGFAVTKRAATEIEVAPGRLYINGAVYSRDDTVARDLFANLPLATKKIVAVVGWGQEIESDVQPRDFLVDAESGQTEPQAVAMERRRFAEINTVAGVESGDPQPPTLDASVTLIALVTLTTTGIESISMADENKVPSVDGNNRRIGELEGWRTVTEPRISTIASDISALANSVRGLAGRKVISQLARDVADMKERLRIEDGAVLYASDHFLDGHESDPTAVGYDAQVHEGIRFPWAALHEAQLGIFNQYDAGVKVTGDGLLLPAYTSEPRLILAQYAGELSIAQYQFQTFNMVQKSMTRSRLRYGPTFTVCTNSEYWQSGSLNYGRATMNPWDYYAASTFTKDGETFEIVDFQMVDTVNHQMVRLRQVWTDTVEEPYWEKVTTDVVVNGSQIGQSFLSSQDGWLTEIELGFTRLGADGAVNVALVECYRGAPDIETVLASVTVNRADPEMTRIAIPPTFLKAGGRYAVLVTTGGNHYVATVSGADYAQGTLFYSTDGAYFEADLTRDLMMTLRFAKFSRARVVTELKPLELAGGITAIDILAESYVPNSCEFKYEIQINGTWHPLDQYSAGQLTGLPALLPFRAVFVGTSDVMPAVRLAGSRVRVGRPKTTFKHFSTVRNISEPSSSISVTSRLEGFFEPNHDLTIKLKVGASEVAATAVEDTIEDPDLGHVIRKATFTLGEPTSSYAIIHEGVTVAATNTFHVAERYDQAF